MKRINNHQYIYIYINQDVHKGLLCIKDTNIPLYLILEDISKGYTIKEIVESHSALEKETLQNALEEIAQHYSYLTPPMYQ
ncbi:DUF433 domain-containing protein [Patescibacteria group bacterium]|nr:DUF433 domain-containing protein [Patescibacteria group bacterium]MBU4016898.1 DUF433 domain-containing protein [Patescibacteria group bacterium]MBU4099608.1 DUF433 domain-containing protein [Patescibacteria group bacterium]